MSNFKIAGYLEVDLLSDVPGVSTSLPCHQMMKGWNQIHFTFLLSVSHLSFGLCIVILPVV